MGAASEAVSIGRRIAVVGVAGSGKTTVAKAIAELLPQS